MVHDYADIEEWMALLREMGNDTLKEEREARMKKIETAYTDSNFLGQVLARLRAEYTQHSAYLAVRAALLDEYFALPWYKRIFYKPRSPQSVQC